MPGPKPRKIVEQTWTPNLAYAVGLLVTDGCLSRHGNLIDLTSKDKEQLRNFNGCIGVDLKIGKKYSGFGLPYSHVQFRNVIFYRFLLSIGLTPAKSKTVGAIKVPKKYFFDFLRGVFDGDGSTYSYWDKRWKSSFMFYVCFASASKLFVDWLRTALDISLGVSGHISYAGNKREMQLKYGKKEGLRVVRAMYYRHDVACLSRKRLKIDKMLAIVGESVSS